MAWQPAPKYWSQTLAVAAVTVVISAVLTSCPQAAKQFHDSGLKSEQSESAWQDSEDALGRYDSNCARAAAASWSQTAASGASAMGKSGMTLMSAPDETSGEPASTAPRPAVPELLLSPQAKVPAMGRRIEMTIMLVRIG
jgi:hypothetical protein